MNSRPLSPDSVQSPLPTPPPQPPQQVLSQGRSSVVASEPPAFTSTSTSTFPIPLTSALAPAPAPSRNYDTGKVVDHAQSPAVDPTGPSTSPNPHKTLREKGSFFTFAAALTSPDANWASIFSRQSQSQSPSSPTGPTSSGAPTPVTAVPSVGDSSALAHSASRTGRPKPRRFRPLSGQLLSSSLSASQSGSDSLLAGKNSHSSIPIDSGSASRTSDTQNKMHQTSSRLLRMTEDDRPFLRDFKDLFSTLIVSLLPLGSHRVRLTRVEHTFLSEEAINNLGSLKFSQSNRMPDPKDPSRIVTTTTTTTFSMAKDMARSICQRFLDARFIESADGKYQSTYPMRGTVWQLTPKGICVLDRFCSRNGIQQRQVTELISTSVSQLVILERDPQTDKILTGKGTIEVIFRRFMGANGLNVKSNVSAADSDSLSDYRDGLTGVKIASERKVGGRIYKDTFTGKAASDWLMDCCTIVDRREPISIVTHFVELDLVEAVQSDRSFASANPGAHAFQPTKTAVYQMTARGRDVFNGSSNRGRSSDGDGTAAGSDRPIARDSNTQRLDRILRDAALRLLFRENLRETHCEENLSFYQDVAEFVESCHAAIDTAKKVPNSTSLDAIKEIMAQAYGIYNAFLAPGSPCELNIDHQLRSNLATRMTKAVGQDVAMIDTLKEVTALFAEAQNAVFKLMASDSVPKFMRNAKYEQILKDYDFEARLPERSHSRSNGR